MKELQIPFKLQEIPEIKEILNHPYFTGMKKYPHHGSISCHAHTLRVTEHAFQLAKGRGVNLVSLIRGALLHDFYLYDWHGGGPSFHGLKHPALALANAAECFNLNEVESDIIKKHMFPLTPALPLFQESLIVSAADKIAAWTDYHSLLLEYFRTRWSKMRNRVKQTPIHR
jgi:uncharacterized protein